MARPHKVSRSGGRDAGQLLTTNHLFRVTTEFENKQLAGTSITFAVRWMFL